jgi:hypothetical protein
MAERKLNCWEFEQCGRGPGNGGRGAAGRCAAAFETRTDGVNSGRKGGRACWAVAGTQCSVRPKTASTATEDACLGCLFYLLVMEEEYPAYESTGRILELLR